MDFRGRWKPICRDGLSHPIFKKPMQNYTTRTYLIYDKTKSSQIAEKTSQNRIYDDLVMILDIIMEWASQIKSIDIFS